MLLVAAGADRRPPGLRILPESDQVEIRRRRAGRWSAGCASGRARPGSTSLRTRPRRSSTWSARTCPGWRPRSRRRSLYTAGDRRVSQEVVRALAGETRSRQYWELTQALEEARRADALRLASAAPGVGRRAAHPPRLDHWGTSATSARVLPGRRRGRPAEPRGAPAAPAGLGCRAPRGPRPGRRASEGCPAPPSSASRWTRLSRRRGQPPRAPDLPGGRTGGLAAREGVQLTRQTGLLARRRVLVDDALRDGLVEGLDGPLKGLRGLGGLAALEGGAARS